MTTTLNRNSAVPLYLQLADELRNKILSGEWQPEQRIPSENELNQIYSISRMTIRQVLGKLVDEGLVFRVHGKGTFVAQPKIATRSPSYHGVREQLEQQGYSTRTEMLNSGELEADVRLARELDVPVGTPLTMMNRNAATANGGPTQDQAVGWRTTQAMPITTRIAVVIVIG